MKTLCLYYSRTQLTKGIMEEMASLLDADLLEYTDGIDRSGVKGYIKSCIDSFRKPPMVFINGEEPDWDSYDTVVVGMPVWVEEPCVVGRMFLARYSSRFAGKLYLVVSHMAGADYDKTIRRTYRFCTKKPTAHLSVQTKDHDPGEEIRAFAEMIREQAE